MSIGLPSMINADGIKKGKQVKFGGLNHSPGARDGELWSMKNLSSDLYPLLSPRKKRWKTGELEQPNGFYAKGELFWVDGTDFYSGGVEKGTVENGKKKFCGIGIYTIILPDKAIYNRETGEFSSIEAAWSGSAKMQDGTYAGEQAEANTIYAAGADWGSAFREGDAVSISGCTKEENNKTIIIREIDGDYLRFYENSFAIDEGGDTESISIKREMPELDYICENENRLWGCKGSTIYASKLGDPFNWNVFDGLSTDSYAADVGSAGEFTACCSYLGYPCFFKEEHIYKVYGDKPSNFQVMGSASLGVEAGSWASLAIAGEVLFYLSRTGIVAYSGGIPQNIASAFGTERFKNAVGGSDGTKYYVSMQDAAGDFQLFVFDTRTNLWHREDEQEVIGFGWAGELYFLNAEGEIWLNGNAREIPEGATEEAALEWEAEFADFYEYTSYSSSSTPIPEKKGVGKFQIRIELDEGANVQMQIQYDSDGVWKDISTMTATKKRSFYLPVIPHRCDHYRLKIKGSGGARIYSLAREYYTGSELKSEIGRQ